MCNNILFCDTDGVLNNDDTIRTIKGTNRKGMDPLLVNNLKHIVVQSGCKIVVSSAWRLAFGKKPFNKQADFFVDLLDLGGQVIIDAVIDRTPCMMDNDVPLMLHGRMHEIQYWLDHNPGYGKIAIVDDVYFDHPLTKHLFQTDSKFGLTKDIADKIIQHLI